ncbi:SDR family oxidoreductase [Microbacterium sp. ARD31]|uniref:SDR family NAD(P)-dependent oxidoreductase n=1 Tax=Microbacterium sp. ARD31 TaxID=2962576 RepID=UPI002881E60B|nr:SDR family oxidoreductase [Microbacterium sp. ARD31]MDT0188107.1 SDR family oxidoreductase [Microbacterium sp. ARD31]
MDLHIAGQRAFVSGSTQGIGYAIARGLAAEGASVVVNGRTGGGVDGAVARLRGEVAGADVTGIAADLGDPDEVDRLLDRLEGVDILVNNVGLFGLTSFADIDDATWQTYLDVNLLSAVRLSRRLMPPMLERGTGRIVLISSESGVNVPGDMVHYGVTKAALIALGNGLAKLTRGTGVTVNTVLGGPTWSEGVAGAVHQVAAAQGLDPDAMKDAIIGGNPTSLLERFIEPQEVADLVVYLASARAAATNGAALRADGGVLTTML